MTSKRSAQDVREDRDTMARQALISQGVSFTRVARRKKLWWVRQQMTSRQFSPKRIRRWRDRRMTSLIRGQLVAHRRASFAAPHKSRQQRG